MIRQIIVSILLSILNIPNIHLKLDSNRSGRFGDYLDNNNPDERQTVDWRQTDRQKGETYYIVPYGHNVFRKYKSNASYEPYLLPWITLWK